MTYLYSAVIKNEGTHKNVIIIHIYNPFSLKNKRLRIRARIHTYTEEKLVNTDMKL